jgi:hypothetical protein
MSGVRAPFVRLAPDGGDDDRAETNASSEISEGEMERGVETWLAGSEPIVATIEGDGGGSGERVKYTTFANEPPTCGANSKASNSSHSVSSEADQAERTYVDCNV